MHKNCLNGRLSAVDNLDPVSDINCLHSWMEFATVRTRRLIRTMSHILQSNPCTDEEMHVLFTSLSICTRHLLRRRYVDNDTHINSVRKFLCTVCSFVVPYIGRNSEVCDHRSLRSLSKCVAR